MAGWAELAQLRPDITGPGGEILYQFGVGLAFLATVRPDGGPRVHPMCPMLVGGRLTGLLIPSPKRRDLLADGRFALHTFPREDDENALYLTGAARPILDPGVAAAVVAQFGAERPDVPIDPDRLRHDQPFEFDVTTAMLTLTKGHGDWDPVHLIWHEDAAQTADGARR